MKRLSLPIFLFLLFFKISAQKDSTSRWRFSGFQISSNITLSGYQSLSLQQYKSFIKNDPNLNDDLTGFHESSFDGLNFFGGFALRFFVELPRAERNTEYSIGVVTGGAPVSSLACSRQQTEVIEIYVGQQNKESLFAVNEIIDSYHFSISNSVVYIPIGIHKTTDKKRYLWGSAGLEIAPGFAKYNYYSSKSRYVRKAIIDPTIAEPGNKLYYWFGDNSYQASDYSENLSTIGFSGYFSLPLSANLHFAKSKKILRSINLYAQIAPILLYAKSQYNASNLSGGVNGQLGIRLAW